MTGVQTCALPISRALRENVAFVPGAAAYLDGRGRSSMRLNFSAVDGDEIREGIRRIGEVVKEQVALYGTLTGADRRAASTPPAVESTEQKAETAKVLPMRRRAAS